MATFCKDCGARIDPCEAHCWICRARQTGQLTQAENPYASPQPIAPIEVKNQFSLETLFLIVTLAAVAMGALMIAPGLGTFMIVLAAPALVRTVIAGRRSLASGQTPKIGDKILVFLASAALMWVISIAATITFCLVCTATGLVSLSLLVNGENTALIVAFGAGLAAAALVATWLLWITRPQSPGSTRTSKP